MNKSTFAGILILIVLNSACGISPVQYVERGNKLFDSEQYADAEINYRKAIQKDAKLGEAYYRLGTLQLRESHPEEAYKSLLSAVGLLPGRHDVAVILADAAFAAYLRNPRSVAYYDQVRTTAARLLKEDSRSFDGLRLKGYVEMFDRHYPEAIALLKAADGVRPTQPDVVYALVQCLIQAHQGPEAEKLGQSLTQTNKAFAPVYEILYRYYMGENRPLDAEAILKAKIANNPENAGYRLELAAHYAGAGNEAGLRQTIQQLEDGNRFPDAAMQIGDFYAALNRMDDASREFQTGATKYLKRRLDYEKRIARVFIAQGKKDQAIKLIEEILKEHGDDYDTRMMRASINVDSGDPGKLNSGAVELKALATEKPTDATVRLNLGKARLLAGDPRGALTQFKEALNIDPELTQARLLAADTSLRMQDYQQALQYADQAIAAGVSPIARLIRVKSLAGMGTLSQATAEANRLAREFPNDAAPKLELASLKLGQKNFAEAESIFRALYTADRTNLPALQGLIQSFYVQNRYDAAIETLKQELSKADSAEIRAMLADACLRGRKLDLAIQEYGGLAGANPSSSFFHLKLGDAYLQKGNTPEALAQFQIAKKLAPKDAMASSMLALSLQQAGRAQEAIRAYREALALDSENPVLMNNLAYLISESGGDLNDALQLAQGASRRHPGDTDLSDTVGWIFLKKNMTDDALHVLSDIVRKNPAKPVYRYHLAAALVQKGDKVEAKRQLEAALANKPARADEAKITELLSATR
jgi:tetratricopeptide (TPR) repeat protein